MWREDHFSFEGKYYRLEDVVMQPKPVTRPRPMTYAGGESEVAKQMIAARCDAYVMYGDDPARVKQQIADMSSRRDQLGLPPMRFGVAGYTIVRETEGAARKELERITDVKRSAAGYENFQQWLADPQLDKALALEDYSVSNREVCGLVWSARPKGWLSEWLLKRLEVDLLFAPVQSSIRGDGTIC